MAPKSDKEKNDSRKSSASPKVNSEKPAPKAKKQPDEEDDEDDEDSDTPKAAPKKGAKISSKSKKEDDEDDDDVDDDVEEVDEWEKAEEEANWDPDFDEFDVPKSKTKKAAGGTKKAKRDDDLGVEEEFWDLNLFKDRGFNE